jgi:quercetin dioxygenase-like cupin family protein
MARPHLASGELTHLEPLGARVAQSVTHALVKSAQIEIIRVVLPAGKSLPRHEVPGEITVQCLEGTADFITANQTRRMQAGDFLHLAGHVAHEIKALEDASLLVTIRL